MKTIRQAAISCAIVTLAGASSTVHADEAAAIESRSGSDRGASDNQLRARLDLSHSTALDTRDGSRFSFSDLRLTADATRMAGLPVGLHLDGRARRGWDEQTDDRLTVRDAYLRLGDREDTWNLDLGRQVVREVAAAEVDGMRVTRRLGTRASATLFGGLMPHPVSGDLDSDFATAGGGYEHLGRALNHAGGAVVSWYRGQLDRAYLTQRTYVRAGDALSLSSFGILDVVPTGADSRGSVDLTSLMGTVRYRPRRWLDSTVSATHHHTVLPGKWWTDWLNERRREIGFVLDGDDPVGTRITSVRWTNNVHIVRSLTPYVRARRDWRHTDGAKGYEARGGLKWRGGFGYADASYAYRDYFGATHHLAGIDVGRESTLWGAEAGVFALRSRPHDTQIAGNAYDANVTVWLQLGEALGTSERLHLLASYRGLFEPGSDLHSFFTQIGYRL